MDEYKGLIDDAVNEVLDETTVRFRIPIKKADGSTEYETFESKSNTQDVWKVETDKAQYEDPQMHPSFQRSEGKEAMKHQRNFEKQQEFRNPSQSNADDLRQSARQREVQQPEFDPNRQYYEDKQRQQFSERKESLYHDVERPVERQVSGRREEAEPSPRKPKYHVDRFKRPDDFEGYQTYREPLEKDKRQIRYDYDTQRSQNDSHSHEETPCYQNNQSYRENQSYEKDKRQERYDYEKQRSQNDSHLHEATTSYQKNQSYRDNQSYEKNQHYEDQSYEEDKSFEEDQSRKQRDSDSTDISHITVDMNEFEDPPDPSKVKLPNIVSRAQWGALPAMTRVDSLTSPADTLVFSFNTHTAPCEGEKECHRRVREIQARHMGEGLADIQYSFLVGGDGQLYEGRGWALQSGVPRRDPEGHNYNIAFIGKYKTPLEVPKIMIKTVQELVDYANAKGFIVKAPGLAEGNKRLE